MKFELTTVLYAICVVSCTSSSPIEIYEEHGMYPKPLKKQMFENVERPVPVLGRPQPLPIVPKPAPETDKNKPAGVLVEESHKIPEGTHHPYQQQATPPPQQKPLQVPQRPPIQTYPSEVGQEPQPDVPKPQQKPVDQPQRPPLYPHQPQRPPQNHHQPQVEPVHNGNAVGMGNGFVEPTPKYPHRHQRE